VRDPGAPEVERLGLPDELLVEVCEERRIGVAGELDERGRPLVEAPDPVDHLLRRLAQLLGRAELDRRAPHVVVAVVDEDAAGARPVALSRDRARDGRLLDVRPDPDGLPRLHVRADAHRELGVALQPLLGCHAATLPGRSPA
jgi:hypothetical protein